MRIVGGSCKGRRLASFKGMSIRPTSDKVREAIFNILPREFPFKKVLDLFAGTGAMGIEALSRGAEEVVFVDIDQHSVSVIKKNLEACGLDAKIFKRDTESAIRQLVKFNETFDLIFIDPPYQASLIDDTLKALDTGRLLNAGGFIVAETSKRAPVKAELKDLSLIDERKYGDTLVYFFINREDKDA